MNDSNFAIEILKTNIITCEIRSAGTQIKFKFSQEPPEESGVYVVYLLDGKIPFYVGESGNLRQRLTSLYRCHRSENPHPCHRRHRDVWGALPDCETFCEMYGVRWYSTAGAFGRLEAEQMLQKQLGTNRKEYYLNFDLLFANHSQLPETSIFEAGPRGGLPPACGAATELECCSTKGCKSPCPVWFELTTNCAYQGDQGFQVSTMTGRKEPLLFRHEQRNGKTVIRVWRASGRLDFAFDEHDCRVICQRFVTGLHEGRNFEQGGTAYFNDQSWIERPLNIITAPYAVSIIRYARQTIGLPV